MKLTKRILAALLTLAMLPTLGAFAQENESVQPEEALPAAEEAVEDAPEALAPGEPEFIDIEANASETLAEDSETAPVPAAEPEYDPFIPVDAGLVRHEDTSYEAMVLALANADTAAREEPERGTTPYAGTVYATRLQTALNNRTGDERKNILTVAYSQLGYGEGVANDYSGAGTGSNWDNCTEYARYLGYGDVPWCALFLSWCARQAGISTAVIPTSAVASTSLANNGFGNYSAYNSSVIRAGDFVSLSGNHVGIVYKVYDSTITVIEGNSSDCVRLVTYNRSSGSTSNGSATITHYFRPSYGSGWHFVNNKWYFYNYNGQAMTGWYQSPDDVWFYLDPSNGGAMVTGWKTINGNKYYFDSNGYMATGWTQINSKWYLFRTTGVEGAQITGWYYGTSGYWYYLDPNANGAMVTGWKVINSKHYYFDSNGHMATSWTKIGSYWYLFNASDDEGAQIFGWYTSPAGNTYYLDPSNNGVMVTGTKVINGVTYVFDANGVLQS